MGTRQQTILAKEGVQHGVVADNPKEVQERRRGRLQDTLPLYPTMRYYLSVGIIAGSAAHTQMRIQEDVGFLCNLGANLL